MTLGLYDPDRRYRRRLRGFVLRMIFVFALIVAAAAFAYRFAIQQSEGREADLSRRIDTLEQRNAELERQAVRLEAAVRASEMQREELEIRFERERLTGNRRELADLVAQRLEDGVDPDRLAFFINAADAPRDCTDPVTRAFFLATPAWSGANTSTNFADQRITVTGIGENARRTDGSLLGQFDPAEPITMTFTVIGGERSEVSGLLPLHTSIVLGSEEYRFSMTEGPTGMVEVTADRCAFP